MSELWLNELFQWLAMGVIFILWTLTARALSDTQDGVIGLLDREWRRLKPAQKSAPTSAYEAQRDVSGDDELGIEYTKQREENT